MLPSRFTGRHLAQVIGDLDIGHGQALGLPPVRPESVPRRTDYPLDCVFHWSIRDSRSGVNKINISADLKSADHNKMREVLRDGSLYELFVVQPPALKPLEGVVATSCILGTTGKAGLHRPPAKAPKPLWRGPGLTTVIEPAPRLCHCAEVQEKPALHPP